MSRKKKRKPVVFIAHLGYGKSLVIYNRKCRILLQEVDKKTRPFL